MVKMSGFNCVKALLVIFNIVLWILGVILIGLGLYLLFAQDAFFYKPFLYDADSNPVVFHEWFSIIFCVVGSVITVSCGIGLWGIFKENVCIIRIYLVVLFLLVIAEITICSVTAAVKEPSLKRVQSNMQYQLWNKYNLTEQRLPLDEEKGFDELTHAWDTLQTRLSCCGVLGPADYRFSSWYNNTNAAKGLFVPGSCCVQRERGSSTEASDYNLCQIEAIIYRHQSASNTGILHQEGCYSALMLKTLRYERVAIGLLCFILFIQVLDFIMTVVLMWLVQRKLVKGGE